MAITIDPNRGREVAVLLYESFLTTDIHSHKSMPEDEPPEGVTRGSYEHMMFITLTVSIDYQRDAVQLWNNSRMTYEDLDTQYLFDPAAMRNIPFDDIVIDMQKHGLSKKPLKDAKIWTTICRTLDQDWCGDPCKLLEDCNWDARQVLERLRLNKSDYPYLNGNKIGPLWLRMLRDNVGISNLRNLDKVPIPVDIHVARATLATGVVRGQFEGNLNGLFQYIRDAWFESVKGLSTGKRPMMALDVDEPLWQLSKYGCTNRDKISGYCSKRNTCEAKEFCISGKINIVKNKAEVQT